MTRDARAIIDFLRDEVRTIGFSEVARRSGIERSSLHRMMRRGSGRMPNFSSIALIAMAVDVKLEASRR